MCSNCGHAINVYVRHGSSGVPTLESVLQYYECPHCHATLIPDLDFVDVEALVWSPGLVKKIVEGKLTPEERKKLESTPKGKKILKVVPALRELLQKYELAKKSSKLSSIINDSKKVRKGSLRGLSSRGRRSSPHK